MSISLLQLPNQLFVLATLPTLHRLSPEAQKRGPFFRKGLLVIVRFFRLRPTIEPMFRRSR